MIFRMSFKVSRQFFDPLSEERNLDLRRPGICLVKAKLLYNLAFLSCSWHNHFFSFFLWFKYGCNTPFSQCKVTTRAPTAIVRCDFPPLQLTQHSDQA